MAVKFLRGTHPKKKNLLDLKLRIQKFNNSNTIVILNRKGCLFGMCQTF